MDEDQMRYAVVDHENGGVVGPFKTKEAATEFVTKRARENGWGDVIARLDNGEEPWVPGGYDIQDMEVVPDPDNNMKNLGWWLRNNVAVDLQEGRDVHDTLETITSTIEAFVKDPANFEIPEDDGN